MAIRQSASAGGDALAIGSPRRRRPPRQQGRELPRCVRIGLTQPLNQNTGHSDGAGEQGGDPRPYRQQASERLPRGGKLALAARQKGCQGISQRGVPRHRDPPQAGRPVVRRPRLCSVLARATHQNPEEAFSIVPRSLAGGCPTLPGRRNVTERRSLRDLGIAECAFP